MTSPTVPDLLVEQLHLGELDATQAAAVRAALAEQGDDRLARLSAADAMDLERYPPERMVPRITARATPRRRVWPVALPTLAAAAAGMWWMTRPPPPPPLVDAGPEIVRAKGALTPSLQVLREGQLDPMASGTTVDAGTRVQLRFAPGGARHALIVSVDGRGVPTLHWPDSPTASTAVPVGAQRITVGHAYELDDAPAFERFHLLTAAAPFEIAAVLRTIATPAWTPPPTAHETVVTLRKP